MSETVNTEVQAFWKQLQPQSEAERPWLFNGLSSKVRGWSTKDIFAQANCLAAFLMARGLRAGQSVVIRMKDDPLYLVLDLALQFAGAINITLPGLATNELLISTARHTHPSFFFLDQADGLETTPGFAEIKTDMIGLLMLNDEVENMNPEKLFTLDRALVIGKADWRENAAGMNAAKGSRKLKDVYARIGDELKEISYEKLIADAEHARNLLNENGGKTVWFITDPSSYWRRIMGCFATLMNRPHSRVIQENTFTLPIQFDPAPESVFVTPEFLRLQFEFIGKKLLGKNGAVTPKFTKALETAIRRREAIEQGKKPGLIVQTKYSMAQSSIFSKARKAFGPKCKIIFLDDGYLDLEVRHFFEDAGFKLV
ncbi:MAG: AMP-binding protein [Bacteroidia bacterium]|nr:AMP-binding protein [Bacteroidia bacterium]